MDHPFQHNVIAFDGEQEQGNPLAKMSIDDIYTSIMATTTWLEPRGKPTNFDPTKTSRVKRLNFLFQLEYRKVGQYNHDLNHRLLRFQDQMLYIKSQIYVSRVRRYPSIMSMNQVINGSLMVLYKPQWSFILNHPNGGPSKWFVNHGIQWNQKGIGEGWHVQ